MPERTLFWQWKAEGYDMRAAMRGDFKLLDISGSQFLYNVREDPGERRTLAAEYPDLFQRLQQELRSLAGDRPAAAEARSPSQALSPDQLGQEANAGQERGAPGAHALSAR
jgi:arylsulfatase A-like enzyme